jgi:hypothetical protein
MSIYESATTAIRDTVKWLTALLPTAAITATVVVVAPHLAASLHASSSTLDWLGRHGLLAALALAALGSITWLLVTSQRVLTVEPIDLADLQVKPDPSCEDAPNPEGNAREDLAAALGAGVAMPYFFDKASYDAALVEVASADLTDPLLEARTTRLAAAGEAIRQWSVHDRIQGPFTTFKWAFVLACATVGVFLLVAATQLGAGAGAGPTLVQVDVNDAGEQSLRHTTGCTDASVSTFYLAGGSWEAPRLLVDGPGCAFRAEWKPLADQVEVRPTATP